jgi:putative FmdB family regulatory protein
MPTYEYECRGCLRVFEVRQRISEAPLTTCDACGGEVRRLLSAAPFILKGGGWYVTDYPSAARKKALESEKGGTDKKALESAKGGTDKKARESEKGGTDKKPSAEKPSGEQSSTATTRSATPAAAAPSRSSGTSPSTD